MPDEKAETVADGARLIASLIAPAGENDIEALVISVLTAAARSAEEELREIMERVRAVNAAKAVMRELINKINRDVTANAHRDGDRDNVVFADRGLGGEAAYHDAPFPVADVESVGGVRFVRIDLHDGQITSLSQLDGLADELRSKLDSMSEMGEMESLRLQMAMDRRSKFLTTLSNLLKKISETEQGIIQNLK